MTTALFIVSAADHWTWNDGTPYPTGVWAEELAEPHRLFTEAGVHVTIATPGGVAPTIDANSLQPALAGGEERAAQIAAYLRTIDGLDKPLALDAVDLDDYSLVFVPGGHGPMEDLAVDPVSGRLLIAALDSGRPLGIVCHGPAAMLAATRADGSWAFAGYRMTAFTNAEETLNGLAEHAPWLLQDRLTAAGAEVVEAAPFSPHTIVDRTLYTGQNPASSGPLAQQIIDALR